MRRYYTFPSAQYLEGMVNQTPEDFLLALKVTDTITIEEFPSLERIDQRAAQPNESFQSVDLLLKAF